MIENLFINILEISITSTAAIAIILLFSKFAENHFRKKWRYWVWVFLAVYLIIPFKMDFAEAPIKIEIPPHEMIITEKETVLPEKNPFIEGNGGIGMDNSPGTEPEQGLGEAVPGLEGNTGSPSTEEQTTNTAPRVFIYPIVYIGAVIWAVGAVLVCGWNIAMYIRFSTRSKPWNREVENLEVVWLFERIKNEMGVSKRVRLYENRLIKSPMMVGFFNPRVLLPSEELLPGEYEFVLRHELTHYKRKDILYKFLMMLAASIHWFNPMVGTMCSYAENDIEITCDEAVVKAMEGDRRQEYCATILNIMRRGQNSPLLLSTSFYGGAKVLKKRFSAVLEPRTHRGIILFIIAALIVVISGTMVACGTEGNVPQASTAPATIEEAEKAAEELIEKVHRSMNIFEENDFGKHLSKETEEYINAMVAEKQEGISSSGGKLDRYEYSIDISLLESTAKGSYVEMIFKAVETYYYGSVYSDGAEPEELTTVSNPVMAVYDFDKKEFTVLLLSETGDWIGTEYYKDISIQTQNTVSENEDEIEDKAYRLARSVAETACLEMISGEENDYSEYASKNVEEYIREVSEGKRNYLAENGMDIDYLTYNPEIELLSIISADDFTEVLIIINEDYKYAESGSPEEYRETSQRSHAKLTYDIEKEIITDFVIYGITWMGEEYYEEIPSEIDPRPVVSGPDENGIFPRISDDDWNKWVTYNGTSDKTASAEDIPSIFEIGEYLEYLEENYPEIDDWELDYERKYYELTYCYDPYSYSFRNIYMPKRMAVIKTEQSEEFDRLIVFTYEEYVAISVENGVEPRFERQFRTVETFDEYIDVDMREAVINESVYVLPTSLWFPKEKKMLWIDTIGKPEVYVIEKLNKPLEIYSGGKIFEGIDLSGEKLSVPEGRENDLFFYIPLGSGREEMTIAYYDYETRTVDQYENCIAGENEVFPQVYFLDSDTLVITADGVLSFYRTASHNVMTETFAEIGGNGKGLSDSKVSDIAFMNIDATKGGRYMFIYSDEATGEYGLCTFDSRGNILSNFSLGLDSEGTIGSANYKSGIVYFSYYPDYSESTKGYNYAVDARPDKNHNLQADAW